MPRNVIAACLSMLAFALAIVAGIVTRNPAEATLQRAIWAMVLTYPLAWLIGWVAQRALQEHIDRYKQEHPLDDGEPQNTDNGAAAPDAPELSAEANSSEAGSAADRARREQAA